MKLRNKKTGEIGEVGYLATSDGTIIVSNINDQDEWYEYNSLAELNEEWEDVPEEPKEYWFINSVGGIIRPTDTNDWTPEDADHHKEIGNYFETEEEAEKAVEKLKAWKRLKDKGFRLDAVTDTFFCLDILIQDEPYEEIKDDLKIVFGGEE